MPEPRSGSSKKRWSKLCAWVTEPVRTSVMRLMVLSARTSKLDKMRGFMKYKRRGESYRNAGARVKDFKELSKRLTDTELKLQTARCMDCGVPFCHTGCPLGNLIPDWNDLIWRDEWREALDCLQATNNFPEFTGRLCPAPCETACVEGINRDPVTIKNVEVAIIDKAWEDRRVIPVVPEWHSLKTAAVVGSGPAGLAAAQQLTRAGWSVVVYPRVGLLGGGHPDLARGYLAKAQVRR